MRLLLYLLTFSACGSTEETDLTQETDDIEPAPAPRITEVTPLAGPVGTVVTVRGADLGEDAEDVQVTLAGVAADVLAHSATELTFAVPGGAMDGTVAVTTAGGTAEGGSFDVWFAPKIESMAPSFGRVGDAVVLTGADFGQTAADNSVTFAGPEGRIPAEITAATATSLTVVVPAGAVDGEVQVETEPGLYGSGPLAFDVVTALLKVESCDPQPRAAASIGCWGEGFEVGVPVEVSFEPTLEGTVAVSTTTEVTEYGATGLSAPAVTGTYRVVVRQGRQESRWEGPMQVYDWVLVTSTLGRLPDGTFTEGTALSGGELTMFFTPGTAAGVVAPNRMELLDDDRNVVWSATPNGSYGSSGSGTYGVYIRSYDGPLGRYRGRLVWDDPNSTAEKRSPITWKQLEILSGGK